MMCRTSETQGYLNNVNVFAMCLYLGLSWELVYSGPAMEHVCEGLKPGCSYQTRVYCMSEGGQSPVSHSASAHVRTQPRTRPCVLPQEF